MTSNERKNSWTDEECKVLEQMAKDKVSWKDIAKVLNRSTCAVRFKAYQLFPHLRKRPQKIHREPSRIYRENGCHYFSNCASCNLPGCIEDGYDPKGVKNFKNSPWIDSEKTKLIELHQVYGNDVLSNILRRSVSDIENKKKEMGLINDRI